MSSQQLCLFSPSSGQGTPSPHQPQSRQADAGVSPQLHTPSLGSVPQSVQQSVVRSRRGPHAAAEAQCPSPQDAQSRQQLPSSFPAGRTSPRFVSQTLSPQVGQKQMLASAFRPAQSSASTR